MANETNWQSTFDGIELLETNILRFKDVDFVDLNNSQIASRQEPTYAYCIILHDSCNWPVESIPCRRINWMFEPSLVEYILNSEESFLVVSWSNGLQIEFDDLSQDQRANKFDEFKQQQILGMCT